MSRRAKMGKAQRRKLRNKRRYAAHRAEETDKGSWGSWLRGGAKLLEQARPKY